VPGLLLATLIGLIGVAGSVGAQDTVYKYKGDNGRASFTNIRNLAPSTARVEEMDLPTLIHMDMEKANDAELARINRRLGSAHRELADSDTCRDAVEEAEIPWWRRVWAAHPVWILIGGLMLILFVVGSRLSRNLPPGMWMRTMMTVVPMLLAVGSLATVGMRMQKGLRDSHEEASACSDPLEEHTPGDRVVTKRRAGAVGRIQQAVAQRDERMQKRFDALGSEYHEGPGL
jgi:hypothetical protein